MTIDTTLLNLDFLPPVVFPPTMLREQKEIHLTQTLVQLVKQKRKLDYHLSLLTAAADFVQERIHDCKEAWDEL